MVVRRSVCVDVFAAFSGKLYLVKGAADITYKVDDTIRNSWRIGSDSFLFSGLKWLKTVRTRVGTSNQSRTQEEKKDKECILI